MAILGKPHPTLVQDIKYDAQYGKASVTTGEQLAQASLASELMVCGLAEVPYNKYVGRGQYPKFRTTPIAPSCPTVIPSIHNKYLAYFSSASKLLDQLPCTILQIIQLLQTATSHSPEQFKQELEAALEQFINDNARSRPLAEVLDKCKAYYEDFSKWARSGVVIDKLLQSCL